MAAALAPSTTLLTFSSKLHEKRAAAGLRPKAVLTDAERTVWALSSLEVEAKDDTLHPTEATEAAMAAAGQAAKLPAMDFPSKIGTIAAQEV